MIKNLIVVSNDKFGGELSEKVASSNNCIVFVDKSTDFSRVMRLLKKRAISPALLAKMLVCELMRKGRKPNVRLPTIHKNQDLIQAIMEHQPDRLILFRAGLIINKNVIATGVPILNVHAAIVPDYGGIGSLDRAIKDGAYEQYASLHVVTTKIDEGEVLDRVDYRLNPKDSYFQNELVAYKAAQKLLLQTVLC